MPDDIRSSTEDRCPYCGSENVYPKGLQHHLCSEGHVFKKMPEPSDPPSMISRLLDYILEGSAFRDPTKERTNFGWRHKKE